MSSLSNTQKAYGIVPVSCGKKRGTAFNVGDGKLLTARHVVEECLLYHVPVVVYLEGQKQRFRAKSIGNAKLMVDVALLEPEEVYKERSGCILPLLAIESKHAENMRLTIVGYPEELGAGSSQIEIKVRNHSVIPDRRYDMLTVREDNFELRMYNGFSGAPVITEGGFVVGIVSTETFGKLGYCSIHHIQDRLKACGLKDVTNDWEANDDTPFSKQKCKENVDYAIEQAGSRYHRDNHQKDAGLMAMIDDFCVSKKYEKVKKILDQVERAIDSTPRTISTLPADYSYKSGDYDNLEQYIDKLVSSTVNTSSAGAGLRKLRRIVELNYPRYVRGKQKFLRIEGVAGTGKTHFSCYIAEYLEDKAYPYLLFGSQFNTSEPVLSQLSKMLPFGGGSREALTVNLQQLDARMKSTGQFAVLIIDALNEGAGEFFWKDSLRVLTATLSKYERIKLIITIRDPFVNRIMSGVKEADWERYVLHGFSSVTSIKKALRSYFSEYGIDESLVKGFTKQFKSPLFLLVFCKSFSYLTEAERKNLDRLTLYRRYLKARNVDVAERVSEDEKRDITWMAMNKMAWRSVEQFNAGVISRDDARTISDDVCYRELWQHNLLNALLKENLLMETLSKGDEDMVMFEFENIADVLKAHAILASGKTETEIIELLKKIASDLKKQNQSAAKFENMVAALIAMWNKERSVTEIDEFVRGEFRPLSVRAAKEYSTETNGKKLKAWLDEDKGEYQPENLIQHLDEDTTDLYNRFDLFLSNMTMVERDEKWTILVNDFFEGKSSWRYLEQRAKGSKREQTRLLILLIWMLTTSFPDSRQFLIGLIYRLLLENETQILILLDKFKGCNDHYVLTGLYCAVYGFTLRSKNHNLIGTIAAYVKKSYYDNVDGSVLPDVVFRQWTLMILDRAEYLNPDKAYFTMLKLPFKSDLPSRRIYKNELPGNYFGEGKGASLLYYSLSTASDFYRYTIGGNSNPDSDEFFEIDKNGEYKGFNLVRFLRMIASIIRYEFRYSSVLDNYDGTKYSIDRHHNVEERIGKKYQWIALWRVYAQMSDNYLFNDGYSDPASVKLTKRVWPWMTSQYDRNDPTFPKPREIGEYVNGLDFTTEPDMPYVEVGEGREWVECNETDPPIRPQYIDADGKPWVMLYGYQSDKHEVDKENRDRVVHYNSCFIKEKDNLKMRAWAAEEDFSGGWMEYRQECIDFRWNEFPWSHAYKRLKRDEWVLKNGRIVYPCELKVAYDEQLQEEIYGVTEDRDTQGTSVSMPCAELVESMNLYAAERGLIRKKDDESIVAVSLSLLRGHGTGLLIRKDVLCKFMGRMKYRLYCYISGNKETSASNYLVLHSKVFSACMSMDAKGKWETVQGMRGWIKK